ncbi:xylose isomerase-like [Anticarsia gemmatalis]|uniref:xylose isomerase-like n=1 Tax=Anticarsia gemmatalis TaxID=129554 RepID=UPI003F759B5B
MATYNQPVAKRQKTREPRADNVDYFQGIDKVEYNNMAAPSESSSYRYYNSSERVHSRSMEDWLKYSVSLTEFRSNGSDNHGRQTHSRPWDDNTNSIDNHKRCIKALFDLCSKLGVKYWTAFDSDLVPFTESWDENKTHWDDIVEYIQELTQRYHLKLLWIAPDLHSHPRYASGAFTSNDAVTFVQAAAQIKRCLEVSQRLNAECFLIWPYREGYHTLFQTDVAREIKLFAKLLKLTAEYKDRLNYRCQLLIMPYYHFYHNRSNNYGGWQHSQWRENDLIHTYMWDVTSCLYLLKNYNLDRYYKVSVMPGHHMYMANVYNMLGGVTMTNGMNHYDSKSLTLMMKCIVDQGTTPLGGINLKLYPRRDSDLRELTTTYVKYIDAVAKALRLACSVIAEQILSKHLQQRYSSYYSGFGSRLVGTDISMEECEEYYKKNQHPHGEVTSKHEYLDVVFQRHLDACDHI